VRTEEFLPLRAGERTTLVAEAVAGAPGSGSRWAEDLRLDGASAVLRHADGPAADRPAVTRNTYGTGTAWYVATAPDPTTLDAVLRAALADAGLHAPAELPEGVERVERIDGERIWQFVINHADVDAVVPLRDGELHVPAGTVRVVAAPAE
jgi:beta-galactosidase